LKSNEAEYRLCDLARKYNCSATAVRVTIARMRNKLIHTDEGKILQLKKILEEYIK